MSLPRRAARGGIDARHLGGERGADFLDELARRARAHRGARVLPLEALLVGRPAAAARTSEARDEAACGLAVRARPELGEGPASPQLVHVEQLLPAAERAGGDRGRGLGLGLTVAQTLTLTLTLT